MPISTRTTLADLGAYRRLLVARIDDARWVATVRARVAIAADGLRERAVTCLIVHGDEVLVWLGQDLAGGDDLRGEVIALLEECGAQIALVGLDGSVKHVYALERFEPWDVCRHVDAMPMRQHERERG